jgi:multicomponent Na+:H+ antiporter subunit D
VIALKVVSVGTFLSTGLKLPYGTWFGTEGAGPRADDPARIQVGRSPVSMYVAMGAAAG